MQFKPPKSPSGLNQRLEGSRRSLTYWAKAHKIVTGNDPLSPRQRRSVSGRLDPQACPKGCEGLAPAGRAWGRPVGA